MDTKTDVLIIGAGGGGAILGCALAQKGINTLILEQASGPPEGLRGEILQPNGQRVMDSLGLLHTFPSNTVCPVRFFHFRQIDGKRLCTIDYDMLPAPYNRALVTLPNTVHHAVLKALESQNPGGLWYKSTFKEVFREGNRVAGVIAEKQRERLRIEAKLVVGADGPLSQVREALRVPTHLHRYSESYLISILPCPEGLDEAQYFLGEQEILGIFPAAERQVFLFYMIHSGSMPKVKQSGAQALRSRWKAICPELTQTFDHFEDWPQTAYMPTGRVRAKSWVSDGAVLIGDAAHGMNPHASQGRMQAMVDAITLADLIPSFLEQEDFSAQALKAFEKRRRPQVETLQRLADEEVFFWNAGNPVLVFLRNRVFTTLDRNKRLRYQVLEATAGLRETAPFGLLDRLQAARLLPDPYADRIPANAFSSTH